MSASDLVSVIIPAYNAAASIDETLRSVRSQTHRNLEVIIIDDGSSDATAEIARRHASRDVRLRLIQQENGGVAAARNRGIAEASAELVAPVDADDLWASDKIEQQLLVLRRGGEKVGLVYTWFALIDEMSRIIGVSHRPTDEGDVLRRLLHNNFVGNGSSPLMRKAAVLEAGCYDASLRARSAQGCEDYKLYLRISERHNFSLVPEFLTGYRQISTNMSSDVTQMFRSWEIVAAEMRERHPDLLKDIEAGGDGFLIWLLGRAREANLRADRLQLVGKLLLRNPRLGAKVTVTWPARRFMRQCTTAIRGRSRGQEDNQAALQIQRFMVGTPEPE
jgi:glycosyltransferase involved in cell wall biosynthesis